MPKKKQKRSKRKTRQAKSQPTFRFYKKNISKFGEPIHELEQPKARLTKIETKILSQFKEKKLLTTDNGISMRQVLEFYTHLWPIDNLTTSTCSRYLQSLKDNFFLEATKGMPVMLDKIEQRYGQRKKALFWLSEQAQNDTVRIDQNRWVIFNGNYVATERTRQKVEARETNRVS